MTVTEPGLRSIGDVLRELKPEFPDLTISKVRFLESKGLVVPARTPTGFRRYSAVDIERIAYVLRMQRERYLPLKVIRTHLDAMSRGQQPPAIEDSTPLAKREPAPTLAQLSGAIDAVALTESELLQQSGLAASELKVLIELGLVDSSRGRHFDGNALNVATAVAGLAQHGITARHLRPVKLSVDRVADLIERVSEPMRSRPDGRSLVEKSSKEISELILQIQALVVLQRMSD